VSVTCCALGIASAGRSRSFDSDVNSHGVIRHAEVVELFHGPAVIHVHVHLFGFEVLADRDEERIDKLLRPVIRRRAGEANRRSSGFASRELFGRTSR
jgi:hypothetical protein